MLALPLETLEKIIHSIGFYRRKDHTIQAVCKEIIASYHGKVPATQDELLSLPGVGRKTANLVLAEAFGIPAICVDTHVHRLANELGLVAAKNPYETEIALQRIVQRNHWIEINRLFVMLGQHTKQLCALLSPADCKALDKVCRSFLGK